MHQFTPRMVWAAPWCPPGLPTAAEIHHDRGVTPHTKAYLRHPALPSDPALINAPIRGCTDTPTLRHEVGGGLLLGPAYRFNVYHLLHTADPDALFPLEVETL
jgi:hypothetical protein